MEKIKGKVMKIRNNLERRKERRKEREEGKPVDIRKIDNIIVYLNSYILF